VMIQGNQTNALLYTVETNFLRVEMPATNWSNPVEILDLKSGALTLLFPHNRSFVRLKPATENPSPFTSGLPALPLPPGVLPASLGPQPGTVAAPGVQATPAGAPQILLPPGGLPAGIGPQAPGASAPSALQMLAMPTPMMTEKMELKATGETTNLLGFVCQRYEIEQRDETLEIWATDKLFPYQAYVRNQPHRFGPRMIEERWPGLLTAKKLFPLRATLRFDNGPERFRFEVKSVTPQKLSDEDTKLFEPPAGYSEIQPLPF